MNFELQIMFHILLYAVCVLVGQLHHLNQDLLNIGKKKIERLDLYPSFMIIHLIGLFLFIPLEIVFWILYWIFSR